VGFTAMVCLDTSGYEDIKQSGLQGAFIFEGLYNNKRIAVDAGHLIYN
jgi:hypothetical protein